MPLKRTPLDRIHRELGADMVESGPWQRPLSYGSPEQECLAVRNQVGIIDVSTLGKLHIRGKDAAALLDKVYTHRFSNLRVGRIRYGLLCADNGTILDDGTVTRLSDDNYFVTTTTTNVDLIEEWFKWWSVGGDMCVHVTNVTSNYAAVNVAGPYARQTLTKLTGIDLSPSGFRYMRFAKGEIADIPGMLLRIGFVGEPGWEVYVAAEYGEHLWEAIMDAGSEFGIAPFGLEAQRILRLEKKHIIVGQDTDVVSNPLECEHGLGGPLRQEGFHWPGRSSYHQGTRPAQQIGGLRHAGRSGALTMGFRWSLAACPSDGSPVPGGVQRQTRASGLPGYR